MKDCFNLTQAKFMFKYTQNLHPKCIQSIFETNAQSNHHKTRQISKGNLYLPFRRTSIGQQFITFTGVKLWNNSIPHEFRAITNLHTFLKKYKLYILAKWSLKITSIKTCYISLINSLWRFWLNTVKMWYEFDQCFWKWFFRTQL